MRFLPGLPRALVNSLSYCMGYLRNISHKIQLNRQPAEKTKPSIRLYLHRARWCTNSTQQIEIAVSFCIAFLWPIMEWLLNNWQNIKKKHANRGISKLLECRGIFITFENLSAMAFCFAVEYDMRIIVNHHDQIDDINSFFKWSNISFD